MGASWVTWKYMGLMLHGRYGTHIIFACYTHSGTLQVKWIGFGMATCISWPCDINIELEIATNNVNHEDMSTL